MLLDAMGTLVRLHPPAPLLTTALATAGYPNSADRVAAALGEEIAFYRAHHVWARTPDLVLQLRRECAGVLAQGLDPAPPHGLVVELLVGALRIEPFADAIPFLENVRACGLRAVVVSDWDCSLADHLSQLGLREWVDGVVVSAEVGVTKPDPRIFRRALGLLGVAAHEVVHCGDDPVRDVAGAAAAGIRPILVDRADRYPDVVERVSSLADLLRWI